MGKKNKYQPKHRTSSQGWTNWQLQRSFWKAQKANTILQFAPLHQTKTVLTAYSELKKESEEGESNVSVLQIDFAENFSTFYQDEIQSAHWNKTQITVFTAALWQNGECLPAVLLSNDLSPSKESILIFLEKVLSSLLQSDTKVLHIQSDGPSSQFKNNFIANCLSWFEKTFNAKVYWNFFASSHGKGPVDGIGDTI